MRRRYWRSTGNTLRSCHGKSRIDILLKITDDHEQILVKASKGNFRKSPTSFIFFFTHVDEKIVAQRDLISVELKVEWERHSQVLYRSLKLAC